MFTWITTCTRVRVCVCVCVGCVWWFGVEPILEVPFSVSNVGDGRYGFPYHKSLLGNSSPKLRSILSLYTLAVSYVISNSVNIGLFYTEQVR